MLALLGRRQDGLQPQQRQLELAHAAAGMVKVLVLLVLDLGVGILERLAFGARELLRDLADHLPVGVVLGLGQYYAVARRALPLLLIAAAECHLHAPAEGLAHVL